MREFDIAGIESLVQAGIVVVAMAVIVLSVVLIAFWWARFFAPTIGRSELAAEVAKKGGRVTTQIDISYDVEEVK